MSAPAASMAGGQLDVARIREDFPILKREVNGQPLVYLDNAASAQKPQAVIDAEMACYSTYYSNVHRGVHALSQEATSAFERARRQVADFIGAGHEDECVFVRGTTEAINLVANAFVRPQLQAGDEILVTHMEHHSNIVPWQLLTEAVGATLKVVSVSDTGTLDLDEVAERITERTRLVSVMHVSNVLGTLNPVERIAEIAHARGVPVLVDGAQSAPHLPVDVQALGADFYCFSGHKLCGPTGIGVLWGRPEHLHAMVPWQGGGDMIRRVSFEGTEYAEPPARFEAGTPNIAGAIGLGAAAEYMASLDMARVAAHEEDVARYAAQRMAEVPNVRIIGTPERRIGAVSFVMGEAHPHDVATILDQQGIAIRAGHHCAQPLMDRFGVSATARASVGVYNTREEIDALIDGLHKVNRIFGLD